MDSLRAGHSEREAARILSLSRGTAHRFAAAASADELLVKATSRASKLDRYKPYLRQRWNEGITTATVLHAAPRPGGCGPGGEKRGRPRRITGLAARRSPCLAGPGRRPGPPGQYR
jgi:hypothetical protein